MDGGHVAAASAALERVKTLLSEAGWVDFEHKAGTDIKAWKKQLPGKGVEITKAEGVIQVRGDNCVIESIF
jgi:hypothetical protein